MTESKQSNINLSEQQNLLRTLLYSRKIMALATLDNKGNPYLSQVPFVFEGGHFYIYVSELAEHTGFLKKRSVASVLLQEDQGSNTNPYTLHRASFKCHCQQVIEDSEIIFTHMKDQLGNTIDLLRQIPDFKLFRLTPTDGTLVTGFGKAFKIEASDFELQLMTGKKD